MPFANPLLATPARPLPSRVGIIGAGTIGPDIGYYLKGALPGLELVLVDVAQPALDRAMARIEGYVQKGVAKGKLKPEQAAAVMQGIVLTLDYERLAGCDWVLEAATEKLDLKRQIFGRVEAIVRPDALVTSNTSSLPARWLFDGMANPARATVTHFFAPAYQNPVVEVVDWAGAAGETVDYLRWLFAITGKVPLVTADVVCFMLDRVFDNWCNEAACLLDSATAAEVDTVASELVHAGPFFVLNLARGNPIIVETNNLQMREEGEHYRPAGIFPSVDTWKTVGPGQHVDVSDRAAERIRDRLKGIVFSQSVDIVDRAIGSAADLELGCVLALGFTKGPLRLMEEAGPAEVERISTRLTRERPGMPVPSRTVAEYLAFRRHVLVDRAGDVVVLTIRRPQALNALDDEVNGELLAAIREHEGDAAVSGFVITGFGTKAFCAGADIGRFPSMLGNAAASAQYARDCSRLLVHLDGMRKPVVAAINGMALGGGLELAMRCHGIVAVGDATLQFPEVTLGIAPGIGAMVVPYRRWPAAAPTFHRMLRLAARLAAADAKALGVVDDVAGDVPELLKLAVARARELAKGFAGIPGGPVELLPLEPIPAAELERANVDPAVVAIIERAIVAAAAAPSLPEALEIGYQAFAATACTPAAATRINAFVAGRG